MSGSLIPSGKELMRQNRLLKHGGRSLLKEARSLRSKPSQTRRTCTSSRSWEVEVQPTWEVEPTWPVVEVEPCYEAPDTTSQMLLGGAPITPEEEAPQLQEEESEDDLEDPEIDAMNERIIGYLENRLRRMKQEAGFCV